MTDRINKFNHTDYSYKYIRRLMKILKIKARIRQKKCNRVKIKPEQALVVTYDGKGQIFCQEKEKK